MDRSVYNVLNSVMCKLTNFESQFERMATGRSNSTTTAMATAPSLPRRFVAASVPHLDWHCIPKAGSTAGRTHVSSNGLQINGRTIAEVLGISDAPRKVPPVFKPRYQYRESRESPHGFDTTDSAKSSADGQPEDVTPLQRCFASGVGTVFMTLASKQLV